MNASLPRSGDTMRVAGLLLAALTLALGACKAPPPAEGGVVDLPPEESARSTLAPDDLVKIVVYGHADLSSGEAGQRVDYQGNVSLPLVGSVPVAGLTVEEARIVLQERVASVVRHASVSVSVIEYAPRVFHVLGEVAHSGAYDLDRPVTALQALALGGGFADGADREKVALLRVEDGELIVRFFDAATPGIDGLIAVHPGDTLFVRRSGSGTFRDQMLPYVQGVSQPLSALASLILVADNLDE